MRNLVWVGALLIVLGIAGLVFDNFSYTETEQVVKAGPVEINAETEKNVSIPTVAGIVVLLAGIGLVLVSRKSA